MRSFSSTPGTAYPSRSAQVKPMPPTAQPASPNSSNGSASCRESSKDSRPLQSLDLGLIGNCSISALIDRQARIVWCCLPRFDGDPIFHALLGHAKSAPDDGVFSIEIENQSGSVQSYIPNTAVLKTILR